MFGLGRNKRFGAGPAVYRQETGCGQGAISILGGTTSGLTAGTMIATAMGWRPVEAIAAGDLVLTFDRGLQPVKNVRRSIAWIAPAEVPQAMWPLFVPAGAVGNAQAMVLLPDQPVMLESDAAEMVWGDPFTLIDAADLDGFRGIQRVAPEGPAQTVVLEFEHDEVVFAQHGALLHCGRAEVIALDEVMAGRASGYRSVDSETARDLLDSIEYDEAPVEGFTPDQKGAGYAAFA